MEKKVGKGNKLLHGLLDLFLDIARYTLSIDLHRVTAASRRCSSNADLAQGISGLVSLLQQTSDNPGCSIMLVQCCRELLSSLRELLAQSVSFECESVPFVLEGREEGGDRGECGRSWANNPGRCGTVSWGQSEGRKEGERGTFELNQISRGQLLAGDGILAVLGDVGLYQTFLEDGARL